MDAGRLYCVRRMDAPMSFKGLPATVYVLGFVPASTLIVLPTTCLTSIRRTRRRGNSTARITALLSSVPQTPLRSHPASFMITCDSWGRKLARAKLGEAALEALQLLYTRGDSESSGCKAFGLSSTSSCSKRILGGHLGQSPTLTETCFLCQLP